MKKLLFVLALGVAVPTTITSMSSCSTMMKTMQTVNQVSNVASTVNELSGVLTNTLGLSGTQKTGLGSILTNYIGQTNGIASLLGNKKSYLSQLGNINFNTLGQLKGLLNSAQYLKLLGLGGSGKGANLGGLLGNLTGGSSLSNDAQSVLSGLLLNQFR